MEGISIGNEKMSAFPHYTGWPKKNATIVIRNVKDILDLIPLLYWMEYSFFPK